MVAHVKMYSEYAPIDKWFKSSPFHGEVTGSNPVGGTKLDHDVMVSITR